MLENSKYSYFLKENERGGKKTALGLTTALNSLFML